MTKSFTKGALRAVPIGIVLSSFATGIIILNLQQVPDGGQTLAQLYISIFTIFGAVMFFLSLRKKIDDYWRGIFGGLTATITLANLFYLTILPQLFTHVPSILQKIGIQ